jgi:hypothetical protein
MQKMKKYAAVITASLASLSAMGAGSALAENKPATSYTAEQNASWYETLDFSDESEKENALRGLIEAPEALVIYDDEGNEVWNAADYSFVNELETIPDTINPSLFRNTLYNSYAGLFEVCDGIYQVRGYDMANATFIRTEHGWIVFDVLMCKQDMEAAKALMEADEVYLMDFTSIDDKQDGTDIDITYLQKLIPGSKIVDEDDESARELARHSGQCLLFMSSKDIYNLADKVKKYL